MWPFFDEGKCSLYNCLKGKEAVEKRKFPVVRRTILLPTASLSFQDVLFK